MTSTLTNLFAQRFEELPDAESSAPGRVNLIGEHLDYNGGHVLPSVLPVRLSVAVRRRDDGVVRIHADGYGDVKRTIGEQAKAHWSDHVLGAVALAGQLNWGHGADIAICSTIPAGAGLSSSAALGVALLKGLRDAADKTHAADAVEIARLAKRVENTFLGVPCGIMDQFAVSVAAPGHAVLLNTQTLSHAALRLPEHHDFVVLHSGIERQLTDGRYQQRKHECDDATQRMGGRSLCELSLPEIESELGDALLKRARHCITEQSRVLAMADAMRSDDLNTMGRLMHESHQSMRDDFEISVPEIDALVEDATALGAIGARLTGGGFGGCIVALVACEDHADWLAHITAAHPRVRCVTATSSRRAY
ncbi:MAG: galactokinase [Pseudomonadota bacterium]